MPVVGKTIESVQLAFTAGSPATTDFRTSTRGLVRRLVISTDADCYLNFDAEADDTNFVLTPGCGQISIDNIHFTNISALGVNGGGNIYILAMRD
jgi:hypothetical protein